MKKIFFIMLLLFQTSSLFSETTTSVNVHDKKDLTFILKDGKEIPITDPVLKKQL
ncbi:hypothetical protein K9K77_00590 [Candidatus Babeliales bacterium]|nr:hypothetical protein [Candidatus Babeliales bacterium]